MFKRILLKKKRKSDRKKCSLFRFQKYLIYCKFNKINFNNNPNKLVLFLVLLKNLQINKIIKKERLKIMNSKDKTPLFLKICRKVQTIKNFNSKVEIESQRKKGSGLRKEIMIGIISQDNQPIIEKIKGLDQDHLGPNIDKRKKEIIETSLMIIGRNRMKIQQKEIMERKTNIINKDEIIHQII